MAIVIKSREEIDLIAQSGSLAARVLDFIEDHIKPGVHTDELNTLCHNFITENGATPSPLNYKGFPKSICTSINQVVCHGIPSKEDVLKTGDIVKVDTTCFLNGYHGDTCRTFQVGKCSRAARDLMNVTKESLMLGIEAAQIGNNIGDIGFAIQSFVEKKGYSVVREYCGHGIGKNFHEDPHVTHYGRPGQGPKIEEGMVFTIEPMINQGKADIILEEDNWTVSTLDNKLSAQFEHTIAIEKNGPRILTLSHK